MPGESLSTWRQASVTASLSTINLTWTCRGLNLGLCGERLVTKAMTHGTALNIDIHQKYTQNISYCLTENTVFSCYKD